MSHPAISSADMRKADLAYDVLRFCGDAYRSARTDESHPETAHLREAYRRANNSYLTVCDSIGLERRG